MGEVQFKCSFNPGHPVLKAELNLISDIPISSLLVLPVSQCRLSWEMAAERRGIHENAVRCSSAGSLALLSFWSFSGGSESKEAACKAGALGLILG